MDDNKLGSLIKTIEREVTPPAGLRESILSGIIRKDKDGIHLSPLEKFFFERPVRAAWALSAVISGILWALMGSSYSNNILNVFGGRW